MAIQNQPNQNSNFIEFAKYWQPAGSPTVVWIEDVSRHRKINFVRWGNQIYVPVYPGMNLGIGLHNGSNDWRAYPTYVEAANLWSGGPAEPNDCSPDYMWEMRPGDNLVMDKIVNPYDQRGRPLIITQSGEGFTIGEATFGTQKYRGQIRVYERSRLWTQQQSYRPTNQGDTRNLGANESFGSGKTVGAGGAPQSSGGFAKGIDPNEGRAGIGLGAEVHQQHSDTGAQYNRDAQPVIAMFIEFRSDLQQMLDSRFGSGAWDWYFDARGSNWWSNGPHTASHVPVTPHRPL